MYVQGGVDWAGARVGCGRGWRGGAGWGVHKAGLAGGRAGRIERGATDCAMVAVRCTGDERSQPTGTGGTPVASAG